MALKSTIYKAELQIADMDRGYYQTHALTLARHPSETDDRLMVRVLAFARHASDALAFTGGLSDTDAPDLWAKDLTDAIDLWIDLGQPDEKRVRKACARARQVVVYSYSGNGAELWWNQNRHPFARIANLSVFNIPAATTRALGALAARGMRLQVTIQDGQIWLSNEVSTLQVDIEAWQQVS